MMKEILKALNITCTSSVFRNFLSYKREQVWMERKTHFDVLLLLSTRCQCFSSSVTALGSAVEHLGSQEARNGQMKKVLL